MRYLALVTDYDDLLAVCPCAQLFTRVVAENGAIIYDPVSREETRLANPPSKLLIQNLRAQPGRAERIRHRRKYAEGNLHWNSFYFRGPDNRHALKAQNLVVFCQIAEGIDETTWTYHLRRGDYSRWFRTAIKDDYLADETEQVERRSDLEPGQTRQKIRELVNARYTLPE